MKSITQLLDAKGNEIYSVAPDARMFEALKLMAIVLFCLGAVGVAWSIYNKMTGKEWGNQAFGSLLSFAFGTIVAVFWQLAQGRAVGVDTNF